MVHGKLFKFSLFRARIPHHDWLTVLILNNLRIIERNFGRNWNSFEFYFHFLTELALVIQGRGKKLRILVMNIFSVDLQRGIPPGLLFFDSIRCTSSFIDMYLHIYKMSPLFLKKSCVSCSTIIYHKLGYSHYWGCSINGTDLKTSIFRCCGFKWCTN